jgi:hypothetical protein
VSERIPFPAESWPLLRKALEHIAAHPDEFYMRDWVLQIPEHVEPRSNDAYRKALVENRTGLPFPKCGTVACLAGHIVLASGGKTLTADDTGAFHALGLTPSSGVALLLGDVFEELAICTYAELREALEDRFTFPEPLPEPVAVSS